MNLQLLVLMAGPDAAFADAGFIYPKNLIEIDGIPLLQRVLDSLVDLRQGSKIVICVVRREEDQRHHTGQVIRLVEPKAKIVVVHDTAGAACSALLAIEHLVEHDPLVIVNGDQILNLSLSEVLSDFQKVHLDGGIVVFEAIHPRWSYVRCDENGMVVETAEKRPISNLATAGFYYFARAKDFIVSAMEMIKKDAHTGGHFYICPVYNEMILHQAKVGIRKVSRNCYFSLATPTGVQSYEKQLEPSRTER